MDNCFGNYDFETDEANSPPSRYMGYKLVSNELKMCKNCESFKKSCKSFKELDECDNFIEK